MKDKSKYFYFGDWQIVDKYLFDKSEYVDFGDYEIKELSEIFHKYDFSVMDSHFYINVEAPYFEIYPENKKFSFFTQDNFVYNDNIISSNTEFIDGHSMQFRSQFLKSYFSIKNNIFYVESNNAFKSGSNSYRINYGAIIIRCPDDYFLFINPRDIYGGSVSGYICDQFDGLIEFIGDDPYRNLKLK